MPGGILGCLEYGFDRESYKMCEETLEVREYGNCGPFVVAVHGGPGAPGSIGTLARMMGEYARVVEPFQRRSGEMPLTVDTHIEDMKNVISQCAVGEKAIVVGHSWGAMLALAFAADYPDLASRLILIGCGTFDLKSREAYNHELEKRFGRPVGDVAGEIKAGAGSANEKMSRLGQVFGDAQSYDAEEENGEVVTCDMKAQEETWADMVRLQSEGVYPQKFRRVSCPVIMLHGDYDPHPGKMVHDTLARYVPAIEYVEFHRCGHYPWRERYAKSEFLQKLRECIECDDIGGSDTRKRF